jgi:ribosomal protein L37AE/L43A
MRYTFFFRRIAVTVWFCTVSTNALTGLELRHNANLHNPVKRFSFIPDLYIKSMKYCPECGYKLDKGTEKYCPECGEKLAVPAPGVNAPAPGIDSNAIS